MKQFLFTLWMIFSFGLIYSILGLGWNDIKMSNLPAVREFVYNYIFNYFY